MPDHVSTPVEEAWTEITDPTTPDYYANTTYVTIGQSETTIFFGRQLESVDGTTSVNPLCRITLTHDHFLNMMRYWHPRASFLFEVYAGISPSLRSADPEKFQVALERFHREIGLIDPSDEDEINTNETE